MRYFKYNIFVSIVIILLILHQSKKKVNQEHWGSVGSAVSSVASGAGDILSEAKDYAEEKVEEAKEFAEDVVEDVVDAALGGLKTLIEELVEVFIDLTKPLWNLLTKIFEFVRDVGEFIIGTDNIISRLAKRIELIVKINKNVLEIIRLVYILADDETYKCINKANDSSLLSNILSHSASQDESAKKDKCNFSEVGKRIEQNIAYSKQLSREFNDLCSNVAQLIERTIEDIKADLRDLTLLPWNIFLDPAKIVKVRGIPVGEEWFNILNKTIDGLNSGTRAFFNVIEDVEDYINDELLKGILKIPLKSTIQSGVGDLQLDNIKLKEEKTFVDASKAIITSIDDFTRTFGQLLGKIPGCDKKD